MGKVTHQELIACGEFIQPTYNDVHTLKLRCPRPARFCLLTATSDGPILETHQR
jgi:hypothetical protein